MLRARASRSRPPCAAWLRIPCVVALAAWPAACAGAGSPEEFAERPAARAEEPAPPADEHTEHTGEPVALADGPEAATDRHGDALPHGAVLRLGTTRLTHTDEVSGVAFRDAGARLHSVSFDGTLVLWDAATGERLESIESPVGPVLASSATADGRRIVVGSAAGSARLVSPGAADAPPIELPGQQAVLSPDGRHAVCWSRGEDVVRLVAPGGTDEQRELALEGTRSVVGSGLFVGELVVLAGSRSPTGRERIGWLSAWHVQDGEAAWHAAVDDAVVESLAATDTGLLFAGLGDGRVLALESGTGRELGAWQAHPSAVTALGGFDGDALVSADRRGELAAWSDVDAPEGPPGLRWRRAAHLARVHALAVSTDARRVASAGADHAVRLLDLDRGVARPELFRVRGRIASAAVAPDGGRAALGAWTGRLGLWPLPEAGPPVWVDAHDGPVHGLRFAADGRVLVSGGRDGRICAWRARDGAAWAEPLQGNSAVLSLAVSPDGTLVAAGGADATVRLVRLAAADEDAGTLETQEGVPVTGMLVSAVAFAPDGGDLYSGTSRVRRTALSGGAVRWDVPVGSPVQDLAVSPDGALLAVALAGRSVRLLDAQTGAVLVDDAGRAGRVEAVAFVDGGRTLVSAAQGESLVRRWSVADASARTPVAGHVAPVTHLVHVAGGGWLSASMDGTALLWSADP